MAVVAIDGFVCVPSAPDLYQTIAGRYPDEVSTVLENI